MNDLPSPWREFLTELDAALSTLVMVHCIGGLATPYWGYRLLRGDTGFESRSNRRSRLATRKEI